MGKEVTKAILFYLAVMSLVGLVVVMLVGLLGGVIHALASL